METPVAEAPTNSRQLAQTFAHGSIVGSGAPVANRGSVRIKNPTRPPFAHLKRHLEMSDSLAPRDGRHHLADQAFLGPTKRDPRVPRVTTP